MTFKELNLIDPILAAITREGYEAPSPIQTQAIPYLLEGRDLFGCAQTGTGKTAAFAIPILQKLYKPKYDNSVKRTVKALVLTPTRELALQISDSFKAYGFFTGLQTTVVYGGVRQVPQVAALRKGIDILVATPGRLNDLIRQNVCDLSDVNMLVLDEADRMLDMGFIGDVKKIIARINEDHQTLLFSATKAEEIEELASTLLRDPVNVTVTPASSTVETIEQKLYYVDRVNKGPLLEEIIKTQNVESVLIFARTKHGADKICKTLNDAGIMAGSIHSNKSQNARQAALRNFKNGKLRALVATDIAARGIDVDRLSHVINYDLPESAETYVHRIGRTGRAGLSGIAISFCANDERMYLKSIQKLIKIDIPVVKEHAYTIHNIDELLLESTFNNNPNDQVAIMRAAIRRRQNKNHRRNSSSSNRSRRR